MRLEDLEYIVREKLKIEGDMGVAMEFSGVLDGVTIDDALAAAKRASAKL